MEKEKIIFAGAKELNASFKDLGAVCDYIRYKNAPKAIEMLDAVVNDSAAVPYRNHNKGMGSRHELGGKKGRYPKKCAALVRKVLSMAISNAKTKGMDSDALFVVHAAANKTQIYSRTPSKGMLYHSDSYGYGTMRHSDVEFSKIEIGLAAIDDIKLGDKATRMLKLNEALSKKQKPKKATAPAVKQKKASKLAKPVEQKA